MGVTIGTLSSSVTVGEGGGGGSQPDPQFVEQIVAIVMRRIKHEQRHEQRVQSEMKVPDRMSEPTTD